MSAAAGRWIAVALMALAVAAGAGFWLQREEAAVLRREVGWLKEENAALGRLRTENARLKAAETPAHEIERLRADRAAVLRLRAEIDAMKRRVDGR